MQIAALSIDLSLEALAECIALSIEKAKSDTTVQSVLLPSASQSQRQLVATQGQIRRTLTATLSPSPQLIELRRLWPKWLSLRNSTLSNDIKVHVWLSCDKESASQTLLSPPFVASKINLGDGTMTSRDNCTFNICRVPNSQDILSQRPATKEFHLATSFFINCGNLRFQKATWRALDQPATSRDPSLPRMRHWSCHVA